MTADERRLWRQHVRGLLRPETPAARPSRTALVTDALLAIALTVMAVFATTSLDEADRGAVPHPVSDLLRLRHDAAPRSAHPPATQPLPLPPPTLPPTATLKPPPAAPTPPTTPAAPTPPTPPVLPATPDLPTPPVLPAVTPPLNTSPLNTPPLMTPPTGGPAGAMPSPEPVVPVSDEDAGLAVLLVVLGTLPLAARRRLPLTSFWAVVLATLAMDGGETWITVLACVIAAYSALAHSRHRVAAAAGVLLAAVLAGAAGADIVPSLPSWLGPYVVLLSAGALAVFVRFWQRNRERLDALRRDRDEATRRAVQAERSRIAGELHDVVTHNVSVMVIQAGAARKVMDAHPEQSKQALVAIEASGRAAMAELRNVMGLLAASEERPGGLEPQPGIDQLDGLIERVRAAGFQVEARVEAGLQPLPPGVDLAVYRVVQEALTNTMKHAAGAAATVTVARAGDFLVVEVGDTGGGTAAGPGTGQGRGLIGLRERLALYGGTLETTRGADGYRLRARIPWTAA
ncbi:sensor histidine kinase [Nonomuraea sp. NPDC050540]|uniref:sensor histidine kinase n=1 Tax=Nonomuraea sp. NPDC050540 TaxID=3364367 RepID=UPI0037ABC03E